MGTARDIRFSLTGPINWAGTTTQVEVIINSVQKGHQVILDAVVEKRTKARGPGHPHGMMKVMRTPYKVYDIEEMMWDMEEDALEVEARNGDMINCRPE